MKNGRNDTAPWGSSFQGRTFSLPCLLCPKSNTVKIMQFSQYLLLKAYQEEVNVLCRQGSKNHIEYQEYFFSWLFNPKSELLYSLKDNFLISVSGGLTDDSAFSKHLLPSFFLLFPKVMQVNLHHVHVRKSLELEESGWLPWVSLCLFHRVHRIKSHCLCFGTTQKSEAMQIALNSHSS